MLSVSADLYDKNLYAYCDNTPVIRMDSDGEFWNLAAGAAMGALISVVAQVVDNVASGNKSTEGIVVAAVSGQSQVFMVTTEYVIKMVMWQKRRSYMIML